MYQDYKDVAEFRMIYITEAHAVDGRRPVKYAIDLDIKEAKNYKDRCTTADMLIKEKKLTIPCLIDGLDNKVNKAYSAHPDRIFLVRKDGALAVAANRGPRGFKPGLNDTIDWLAEFKKTKKEPALPKAEKGDSSDTKSKSNRQK
jgi:hypothetical protein